MHPLMNRYTDEQRRLMESLAPQVKSTGIDPLARVRM